MVSHLVLDRLRRIPTEGDVCEVSGLRFRVLDVIGLAIVSLKVERSGGGEEN